MINLKVDIAKIKKILKKSIPGNIRKRICNTLIETDTSRTMLSKLQKRFNTVNKIEYILLDGQGMRPLNNNSVDAVFSYGFFVYLQH